jgi:ABC-type ATPase involved in cell division
VIEFRDVSLTYPSGVEALKTINLAIKEGEFVYLMGQTGSGKSTLLQLLFKELNPTEKIWPRLKNLEFLNTAVE